MWEISFPCSCFSSLLSISFINISNIFLFIQNPVKYLKCFFFRKKITAGAIFYYTIFTKSSIFDVWKGSKYASDDAFLTKLQLHPNSMWEKDVISLERYNQSRRFSWKVCGRAIPLERNRWNRTFNVIHNQGRC